ncbi:hypothetical protein [uncultured Thiohalocapsa sp.]|nr:hypothetical protein [uncultured Thiohalocapsa sp.]
MKQSFTHRVPKRSLGTRRRRRRSAARRDEIANDRLAMIID